MQRYRPSCIGNSRPKSVIIDTAPSVAFTPGQLKTSTGAQRERQFTRNINLQFLQENSFARQFSMINLGQ